MRVDELDRRLDAVLADGRVSRAELKALRAELADADPDRIPELRARVFDRARASAEHLGAAATLDWVEAVVKAMTVPAEAPVKSAAFFSPGEDCLNAILAALRTATKCADICVFTITDNRIADGILGAHQRGVNVRVISDDDKSEDRGSDVDRIGFSGVALKYDDSPAHMHHKFAVFDRERLLTGSYNWTRSAARENHENILVTTDRGLVARYQHEFDRLWSDLGR
ncbi:MAG: phospholipase D-like domain-containing protein [Deltaproteobacteria bacterium]